jgi:UDP-N-acetyl-D-mannosaminuronate dehydrogenase
MKSLIIGAGEIGQSLHDIIRLKHKGSCIRDKKDVITYGNVEVLNICYPYSKDFVKDTKAYIKQYNPKVTIIHSTVKAGTTAKCGDMVVHSPIHGKHPDLSGGIRTFTKYIGGDNVYAVYLANKFLQEADINTRIVADSKTSELSKILCTSYYGWNILFMKEVAKICKKEKVPFHEVYTEWNWFYNTGYGKLNMPQFVRPVLDPVKGKIGGHCVVNNCDLLDSFITETIKDKNKEYES